VTDPDEVATVPPHPTEEGSMSEKEHHHGDFAEGQEEEPDEGRTGSYAEGEEESEHRHEGSFAEGVEETEHHPEDHTKGDFAEGVESND